MAGGETQMKYLYMTSTSAEGSNILGRGNYKYKGPERVVGIFKNKRKSYKGT
jgi:hypothetical protein